MVHIFPVWELRLIEVEQCAQGHMNSSWEREDLSPVLEGEKQALISSVTPFLTGSPPSSPPTTSSKHTLFCGSVGICWALKFPEPQLLVALAFCSFGLECPWE